jgi:hypothetical protein
VKAPPGVLVHPDGNADVVVAQTDTVGTRLGRAGCGGTGIEHVGERDAGETHHPDDRIRVRHRPAATDCELNVLPTDTRIGQREADCVGGHLHGGFALEAAERVQTHADDCHLVRTTTHADALHQFDPFGTYLASNVTGSAVGERKGWP